MKPRWRLGRRGDRRAERAVNLVTLSSPFNEHGLSMELKEHDGMVCRSCGKEERASEGYPCADCGTFLCLMCTFKGVERCTACEEKRKKAAGATA